MRPDRRPLLLALALSALSGGPARAFEPLLPPGAEVQGDDQARSAYAMPIGPFAAQGGIPVLQGQGNLSRRAWRLPGPAVTLDLLTLLSGQAEAAGFAPLFDCATETCGGFDFRYGLTTLPEPQMHVDLGDFRFLAAKKPGPAGDELLGLLVSRSADFGFAQVWHLMPGAAVSPVGGGGPAADPAASPAQPAEPAPVDPPAAQVPLAPEGLIARLESGLGVALDDLVFETGRAQLAEGDYPTLTALAAWLAAHPQAVLTLVGHTDASGSLSGNLALSKQRAEAVRQWLIRKDGVAEGQLRAAGVGFLAPRASNLTEEGRTQNRRVEALLTSTP